MALITIALLCFLPSSFLIQDNVQGIGVWPLLTSSNYTVEDIDSLDIVIFDLEQAIYEPHYIEIPVYIISDDVINALDFSMAVNVENLEFLSMVDHTGDLQYAAFLNPNDLKLRFTSNSFSAYPTLPVKVVSIRFEVHSDKFNRTDFQSLIAYLNGDKCSTELKGLDVMVSTEATLNENLKITPNPATEQIFIESNTTCTLDMYTMEGRAILQDHVINEQDLNTIDVHWMPRGTYTIRIRSGEHTLRTQKIVLQ